MTNTVNYKKTYKGFLSNLYYEISQRVKGKRTNRPHLFIGLKLCTKEDFMEWALNDTQYRKLHKAWVKAGYNIRLTPSVDRINSERGYAIPNLRWLTHSQNSRLGALSPKRYPRKVA